MNKLRFNEKGDLVGAIVLKETKHCKLYLMTKEEFEMSFLPEGFKPEPMQDSDGGFEIMKGKAVMVLDEIRRNTEPWKSGDARDIISFQWRVKTVIENKEGVFANRVAFKKYNMLDGVTKDGREYKGADARAKLATDLCTAGYDVDLSGEDAFYASLEGAKGIEANVILSDYNGSQAIRVVQKFSEKKSKENVNNEISKEETPF